jgi:hypothetical protein
MRTVGGKLLLTAAVVLAGGLLIGFYVAKLSTEAGSAAYTVPVQNENGHPVVNMEIMTVAAIGPNLSPNPDWVSYLIKDTSGQWRRETVWKLPANATVHVTIYNFDGASALRNNYLARPHGMVGNHITVDGKTVNSINPDDASHTFAVPQLDMILAIPGVADDAKNQCDIAPCPMSTAHRTISFTFHTKAPGHYRWQCFVPCAAGWIDGFGGPMQTIGYMDGFLDIT